MSREQIRSTGAMDARGRGHKGNQVDELGEATDVDRTQERRYRRFPCHRQFLDTMVIVGATVRIHVRRLPSICTQLVLNSIYCPFLPLLPTQPWKTLICQPGSPLLTASKHPFPSTRARKKSAALFLWRRFGHFFTRAPEMHRRSSLCPQHVFPDRCQR